LDVSGEQPRLIDTKFIGVQPDTMQMTNDGKTLVVGLRSVPSQMALMDTDTRVVRHRRVPGYGISGHEWLSANGKYTFIALESTDETKPGGIGVVENDSGNDPRRLALPIGALAPRSLLRATGAALAAIGLRAQQVETPEVVLDRQHLAAREAGLRRVAADGAPGG
jgi:hypothetical protein